MEKSARSRRGFLKGIAFIGVWSLLLWQYLVPNENPQKKVLIQVKKQDLPVQGALVFRQSRVALVCEGADIYALSLVCTHLGCTVTVTANELVCPCHGSIFDRRGAVVRGPAGRSLQRLVLEDRGEFVVVMA